MLNICNKTLKIVDLLHCELLHHHHHHLIHQVSVSQDALPWCRVQNAGVSEWNRHARSEPPLTLRSLVLDLEGSVWDDVRGGSFSNI